MLDIKFIRANTDAVRGALQLKKIKLDLDRLLTVDEERRSLVQELGELQALRNKNSEIMKSSFAKATGDKHDMDSLSAVANAKEEGRKIKEQVAGLEEKLTIVEKEYNNLMCQVPTVPAADTPIGKDDTENVEVERWMEPTKFDFPMKDHIQLGKDLDLFDIERGVKVAGFRGYFLKNEGAQLSMAMMMHAMNKLVAKGFTLMIPPTLIKGSGLFGSGYFKGTEYNPEVDEIYEVASPDKEADGQTSKDKKFLVGTAEPSLLAYYMDETVDVKSAPIKMAGFSQCYRSEIGSYGKDTKGIYRVHEFFKVEQVIICEADMEKAEKIQQEMLEISKELHRDLGLPYRLLRICSGDLGAGKYKQFDMEAWMPSREGYGETGSASNFVDWQSRRLNVKYVDENGDRKFVYMLNNTALASIRTLIALLENHQQTDGSVIIPEVLRPYMGGKERIVARGS